MKQHLPQIALAFLGAIFGVLATAAHDKIVRQSSELSVRYTALSSAIPDYVNGNANGPPPLTIHRYSWKNTGNVGFKDLVLEFAPEGTDAAYDETVKQKVFVERHLGGEFGVKGVKVERLGNVIRLHYERFPVGAIDNVTIDSESLVESYGLTPNDPDIQLKVENVETDFIDPTLAYFRSPPRSYFWPFVVAAALLLVAAMIFLIRLIKK